MPGQFFTDINLYWIGDSAGSGLAAVRPGLDIVVQSFSGLDWVEGTPNGGASLRSAT